MGGDAAVAFARPDRIMYDPMDVVYRGGGDKYEKDREADRQAREAMPARERRKLGKTASGRAREMLDEYNEHLFQVVDWRRLNEDFEWLPAWAQEMDQGARTIQRLWRKRAEEKERRALREKLDGALSGPLMMMNSWRGWKVMNDMWKKPSQEEGDQGKEAAPEGGESGGGRSVRRRKPKCVNELAQSFVISSRTLFKTFMGSGAQAPVQPSRNEQLESLDNEPQKTPEQRNRGSPATASAVAEPIGRKSLTEDAKKTFTVGAQPHKSPSKDPRHARAAPPEPLELPQEDFHACGSAAGLSRGSPSLGSPSLVVSPLSSGSIKHSQQPSRFRPPAVAPTRPEQLHTGRQFVRISQGLQPHSSAAYNYPGAPGANHHHRHHQQQQQQQEGGGGGGGHCAGNSAALRPQQRDTGPGGSHRISHQGAQPPETGAFDSAAAPRAHQKFHHQKHRDERQKRQPPTNPDSDGGPSTQVLLVSAIRQEIHMWRNSVFAEDMGRTRSGEELSTHAERCTHILTGRLYKALNKRNQYCVAKEAHGSPGSTLTQLVAAVAQAPDSSGLESGVCEQLREFAMALEVHGTPIFAADIAAKKLMKSCEVVLRRVSVADEDGGLNKQCSTPSCNDCQVTFGGMGLPEISTAKRRQKMNSMRTERQLPGPGDGALPRQNHWSSCHGPQQQQQQQQQQRRRQWASAASLDLLSLSNRRQDNEGGHADKPTTSAADSQQHAGSNNWDRQPRPGRRSTVVEILGQPPAELKPSAPEDEQGKMAAAAGRKPKGDRRRRRTLGFVAICDGDDPSKKLAARGAKGKGR